MFEWHSLPSKIIIIIIDWCTLSFGYPSRTCVYIYIYIYIYADLTWPEKKELAPSVIRKKREMWNTVTVPSSGSQARRRGTRSAELRAIHCVERRPPSLSLLSVSCWLDASHATRPALCPAATGWAATQTQARAARLATQARAARLARAARRQPRLTICLWR